MISDLNGSLWSRQFLNVANKRTILHTNQKNFFLLSAESLGTSLALECYAGFVSSGFPSKIA